MVFATYEYEVHFLIHSSFGMVGYVQSANCRTNSSEDAFRQMASQ